MDARAFSFEFFPPKTAEGKEKLRATWRELAKLKPRFFSCTYGAGGSTREGTLETVLDIRAAGHEAAPHISCVAATREDIATQLERYRSHGIRHVVALRGDLPSGLGASGEFRYANELVAFKRKVDAGANAAITQYFYNVDAYFRFVEEARKAGIKVPIVPGIMPINNFSQLARFSEACGAEIPRWMRIKLEGFHDDAAGIRAFGLDVVTDICRRLLDGGAPGLHFYTLNQATLSGEIWKRLGL